MYKTLLFFLLSFYLLSRPAIAQVDLPTGRADVNFPLYAFGTGERLNTMINLTYTGGNGILVNELASNVGLGWQLQAGGAVTRSTRGEPDDQVGGVLDGYVIPTGRMYNGYFGDAPPPKAGWIPLTTITLNYYRGDASVVDDREVDVFNYSFNGRNGSFVLRRDGTAQSLDNPNIKIETVREDLSASKIITRLSKFIITDESGIRYTYSEKILDKIILYQSALKKQFFLNPAPANLLTYTCGQQNLTTNYYAVNNWYLSEIADPLTNRQIRFNYQDYNLEYIAEIQGVYSQTPLEEGKTQIVVQKLTPLYKGTMKRLISIDMPDYSQVLFTYFNNDRTDLPGDKALQQIDVRKNELTVMGYRFDYQYFSTTSLRDYTYGFTTAEAANARLCLKSFRKRGISQVEENPYEFTYNRGTLSRGVPARNTAAIDRYGYYNGNTSYPYDTDINIYNNIQNLCLEHNRVVIGTTDIMAAGTLTTIKYPSGGTLTYTYEVNRIWDGAESVYGSGVRVKQTKASDGINTLNDILREYKYVQEDEQTTSGWGYEPAQYNETSATRMIVPIKGNYRAANLGFSIAQSVGQALITSYAKKSMGNVYKNPAEAALFDKRVSAIYGNLVISVAISAIVYIIQEVFSSDEKDITTNTQNSLSHHPKNQNPLPMLYSRVEVYEGSITDNLGKSVYYFTSDKDFAIQFPTPSYAQKPRFVPILYGLLKQKQVFNKKADLVSDIYNKYSAKIDMSTDIDLQSGYYKALNALLTTFDRFGANENYIVLHKDKYSPIIANVQLAYTVDKEYTGPNYQLSRTDYTYDEPYNNLIKTSTTNSLNVKEERRIYYPYNYFGTGPTKMMIDNHIYNTPISKEVWLLKDNVEPMLLSAEIGDYQQIASGGLKATKIYRFMNNSPLPESVIGTFNPASLVRNTTYFKEDANYTYNSEGKVTMESSGGRLSSYIYDDNNQLIIAGCRNAAVNEIAYSSFEPGAKGSWGLMPKGTSVDLTPAINAPTGNYVINVADMLAITSPTLDAQKRYILSYWIKDGNITLNSATISNEKALLSRNGWTLRTLEISNTKAFSIVGSGMVDELRLYPVGAVMQSTTYSPQSEITSTMDGGNMAVYYEYDELGRLKNTYDANRNLTTHSEYQYRQ